MTDETVVSPGESLEPLEVTLPQTPSVPSAGEPRSGAAAENAELKAELVKMAQRLSELESTTKELPTQVERQVQRFSDRRLRKVDILEPEDVKLVADALRAEGGDPEKAAERLGLKAILEERRAQTREPSEVSHPPTSSASDSGKSDEESKALVLRMMAKSKLGDDAKRAVLAQWGKQKFSSMEEGLVELTGMIDQAHNAPQSEQVPSGAGFVAPAGGTSIGTDEDKLTAVDNLYGELATLQSAPSQNRARMGEIMKRLRELGEKDI